MFGKLLNILVNSNIKTRYALVLRPILSKSMRCSNPLAFLKVQSCKLYNNKYMIVSTQITNTKIFSFTPVFWFSSYWAVKFCLQTEKTKETVKSRILFKQISLINYWKIINSWIAKFSGYFWNTQAIIYQPFLNLHDCTFKLLTDESAFAHITKSKKN